MTNIQATLSNTISINSFEKGNPIEIFEDVKKTGAKVVMHNNEPECVLLSPSEYLSLIEELQNAKSLQSNDENQVIFDISMAIPEADVLKELGITEEELDEMDEVELE